MKQFHVLSDGKRVKEISHKEYMEKNGLHFLCGWIDDKAILFVKGSSIIYLSLEQLDKILELRK
jgi:hypothetical protein